MLPIFKFFKRKQTGKPPASSTTQVNQAGSIREIISTKRPIKQYTASPLHGKKPDLTISIPIGEFRQWIAIVKKQPNFNEKGESQENGKYSFAALMRFEDKSCRLYLVKKET